VVGNIEEIKPNVYVGTRDTVNNPAKGKSTTPPANNFGSYI
jgi:hypothetical protein